MLAVSRFMTHTPGEAALTERTYLSARPYSKIKGETGKIKVPLLNEVRESEDYHKLITIEDPKAIEAILACRLDYERDFGLDLKRAVWYNRTLRVAMAEDHIELMRMQNSLPDTTPIFGAQALLVYSGKLEDYARAQERKAKQTDKKWHDGNSSLARKLQRQITRIITSESLLDNSTLLSKLGDLKLARGRYTIRKHKDHARYMDAVVEQLVEDRDKVKRELKELGVYIQSAWESARNS